MTDLDALTAIHHAQEALAKAQRVAALFGPREPRASDWGHGLDLYTLTSSAATVGASSGAREPLSAKIFRAECAAQYAYVANRATESPLLRVIEYLRAARRVHAFDTLEAVASLLDTAERLLREHLEERRVE